MSEQDVNGSAANGSDVSRQDVNGGSVGAQGSRPTPVELLAVARAASSAGARVLAGRPVGRAVETEDKSAAGDWVTGFDRAAERAVRESIAAVRPGDVLSGEEYPTTDPGAGTGYRWSIDPLDGTTNFVRGILYYGTSVAVIGPGPDGEPVWLAGAVTAPALGVQYVAVRGIGAYRLAWTAEADAASGAPETEADFEVPEGWEQLHGPDPEETGPVLATGFGYDAERRSVQVQAIETLLPGFANLRRIGSAALDLCLVAEGALDAYAELGTNEWDWAAGALIAEEAGVPVTRPNTTPGWQSAGHVDVSALPVA